MAKKATILLLLLATFAGHVAAVDTLFIRQTDTIVIRETRFKKVPVTVEKEVQTVVEVPGSADCEDKVFFVYFPLGRYSLDDAAQKAVHEMAERLEENPAMGVRLTGYCDYVGSSDLNDRLSVARATVVANRLKKAYDVDPQRIIVEGKGRLANVKADYSPNRRVEMRLVNMPKMQQQPQPASQTFASPKVKEVAVKMQNTAQAANNAANNNAANVQILATETVTHAMTLAQLARKYYKNPSCWVYIYAMNKSVIRNPNELQVGQQLRIPALSDVDKQITKQEAEEYYRMLRR
ncbi:MAG: OmpA family protein [Paludibacteraceae bacterium]|nr:OmpA family protein [Paludibacteraceae bacterium]